jgi:hypothetical protein
MSGRAAAVALAAIAATSAAGQLLDPDEREPGLAAVHLYSGVGQEIPILVTPPVPGQLVELVLVDGSGGVLAIPRSVPAGRHDLAAVLPAALDVARQRQRACYLQMMAGDEAIGTPLVSEPLLSRMVPVTEIAPHPTRPHLHTRITGWRVEDDQPPRRDSGDTATPSPAPTDPPPRVFSGLRIYAERDVLLHTTHGDIVVALRPDEAPNTAWNFRTSGSIAWSRSRARAIRSSSRPAIPAAAAMAGRGTGCRSSAAPCPMTSA